jgi:hypothetical protein
MCVRTVCVCSRIDTPQYSFGSSYFDFKRNTANEGYQLQSNFSNKEPYGFKNTFQFVQVAAE